jgi:hydrogenase maturation protein HypF
MVTGKSGREKTRFDDCMMEPLSAISLYEEAEMHSTDNECNWHLHFLGRVQGVGFRPYVYQKAMALGLKGEVSNGLDGVHIRLQTNGKIAHAFFQEIYKNPPPLAIITGGFLHPAESKNFASFSILQSAQATTPNLWITPDLSICPACQNELNDPADRRYHYPFITCTQCGPRYSVMRALPFERHFTSMEAFRFCPECNHEFNNPADRRFYAQTMSCPACGIQMEWRDGNGVRIDATQEAIIERAAKALNDGAIVAVKGIGGFLLMADASNSQTIQRLRARKQRPAKPFAIMYPSLETLSNDTGLSQRAIDLLTSTAAPIVLLPVSHAMREKVDIDGLAPGLDKLGIMLPYAPLLYLLAKSVGRPLIATSGNVSGAPISFTNEDALTSLKGICDFFLLHNRDIVAPQDDSVVSIPLEPYPPILLRRSRGWAPACPFIKTRSEKSILATGALMKSSFAIAHHQQVYASQYLGNTDSYEAQQAYRHTLAHLQQLLHMEPEVILADAHPQYFTTQLAVKMAEVKKFPLVQVQHHKAHFAAILGEQNITHTDSGIVGVVWDGTGLGDDGQSWGGEFFGYRQNTITRENHFSYFPYLLGDKMAREPRLSALAALYGNETATRELEQHFTPSEWKLYHQMLQDYKGVNTCSVGRIFDAAACIILGINTQSYEGEAAMRLEALANSWCKDHGLAIEETYLPELNPNEIISVDALLVGIQQDLAHRKPAAFVAAKFHASLARFADNIATHLNALQICFSGGVFQNTLLVNMIINQCSKKYQLHFHSLLSPNDENISFGQLIYFDNEIK